MDRFIRSQIVLALAGTLCIIGLIGAAALHNAARALPVTGTTYVEGVVGVPTQLNPLLQAPSGPQSERDLAALVFSGLTRRGSDGSAQPALAERWTLDAGGTAYTFTLRSGLRWHDATPLTAADVIWTIRSVQNAAFPGDPTLHAVWRNVGAEQIDARRVRLTLQAPYAPFLAATDLPILPAHLLRDLPLDRWPDAPFSRGPIGSGPFRLERLSPTEAVLRPFEGAAGGRPALELLVLRWFPTTAAALEAAGRGDVQGVVTVATLGTPTVGNGLRITSAPLDEYTMLVCNVAAGVLENTQLRQALAGSLDRMALINNVLHGAGQPLDTPLLPDSWAAATVPWPLPTIATAAQALDALGWQRGADGLRRHDDVVLRVPLLVVNTPMQRAIAAEIVRQWAAIGVSASIDAVTPAEANRRLAAHDFTATLVSWADVGGDPDLFALWHSSQAERGANYAGLADPELDQLLVAGRITTDQNERKRIYALAQRRWVALMPGVPLFRPQLIFIHSPQVVPTGLEKTPLHGVADRFRTLGRWTVSSAP